MQLEKIVASAEQTEEQTSNAWAAATWPVVGNYVPLVVLLIPHQELDAVPATQGTAWWGELSPLDAKGGAEVQYWSRADHGETPSRESRNDRERTNRKKKSQRKDQRRAWVTIPPPFGPMPRLLVTVGSGNPK